MADSPPPTARSRGAVALDARFVWFLIGSALLLALASFWVLARFSPGGFGLGFGAPHNQRAAAVADTPSPSKPLGPPVLPALSNVLSPTPTSTASTPGTAAPSKSAPTTAVAEQPAPFSTAVIRTGQTAPAPTPVSPSASASVEPTVTTSASGTPTPTVSPTDTAPVDTTSPSDPIIPPPTDPVTPTQPVDTAVNVPNGDVQVDSVLFSDPDTVTITGLRPTSSVIVPTDTFIDWGEGAGSADVDPSGPLSHQYAAAGTYVIVWGYRTDVDHLWRHTVVVSDTASAAPAPTLNYDAADQPQQFAVTGDDQTPWAEWTLDYGDGNFVAGTDGRPSDDQNQHSYDGTGHNAILTAVGADGQLTTAEAQTP